jgi:ribonuclease G
VEIELVISSNEEGFRIAILEDKKIAELHFEKKGNEFTVGDIYLGKVKRILPSLNAAFVDIGYSKDAFIHYPDLGPNFLSLNKYVKSAISSEKNIGLLDDFTILPEIDKNGSIADVLKPGQVILVQILKEAISTKGPRLTCNLSFAGQYSVLIPFDNEVSVSRKFKSLDTKKKIKQLVDSIRPKNMGVIIRTAAENVELEKIREDLEMLKQRWLEMSSSLPKAITPLKVLSEMNRTTTILRDMLSVGFNAVYTDDKALFSELQQYLSVHQPENLKNLKFFSPKSGLFEHLGIEKQIKSSFGKIINLSGGAYLIIEHTEALHVIDVNSGSSKKSEETPEELALRINLEAAVEIARQLRLRDMGGIIVIDFIDQKKFENKRKIYQKLKSEMQRDKAKHSILPLSKFGLIQMTRQRVRPEVVIQTQEDCPTCHGTGKIQPTILISDEIEKNLDHILRQSKPKKLTLVLHPYLAAFFQKGWFSKQLKWFFKYFKWVSIIEDTSFPIQQVKFLNESGEEIKWEG